MKKPTNIVAPKKIHITIAVAFNVAMAASSIAGQVSRRCSADDEQRAEGADAGRLDRRRNADEDDAEHQHDQKDRRDRVLQQPQLLAPIYPLLRRQCRAELRIDVAAHQDVADIEAGQQQARERSSRPAIRPAIAARRRHRRSPSPRAGSGCRACRRRAASRRRASGRSRAGASPAARSCPSSLRSRRRRRPLPPAPCRPARSRPRGRP